MKISRNIGILILRLSLGLLMLGHGISKISNGVGGIASMLRDNSLPGFFAYGVFIGEIIAPLMLIVGYRTRLAALLFAINSLAAILLAHSGDIFSLSKYGSWGVETLGLYLFGALALFFMGGGKYAISVNKYWD